MTEAETIVATALQGGTPTMPPDVIVRPSGVWNSRAPFHDYLQQLRTFNQLYFAAMLAIDFVEREGRKRAQRDLPLNLFLHIRSARLLVKRALLAYRKSLPTHPPGETPQMPTAARLVDTLETVEHFLRSSIIVQYSSMFETFVQCWVLNMLLCKLESGESWTSDERDLAVRLSPLHAPRKHLLPGIPDIMKGMPDVKEHLFKLAHVFVDPKTGEQADVQATPEINAMTVLLFWRGYRNQCVHRGGVISKRFVTEYGSVWEGVRAPYGTFLSALSVGGRLPVFDQMLRASLTVHYRVARALDVKLEDFAGDRRGHPLAPGRREPNVVVPDPPPPSPPLVVKGDHLLSWEVLEQTRGTSKRDSA